MNDIQKTSFSLQELSRMASALSEKPRAELLYYIYYFGPLHQRQLEGITGFTQAKVFRHAKILKDKGVIYQSKEGIENTNFKHLLVAEECKSFLQHYFAFMGSDDKAILKYKYEQGIAKID